LKTILSNRLGGIAGLLFVIGFLMVTGPGSASAQTTAGEVSPTGTGYKVGTLTVKFVGTANVNEQLVRANMQLHAGGELDDTIYDRDIRNLYKTGLFELIEIKREQVDEHTFDLVVEVTPKFRVLAVRYEGNRGVKTKRIEEEVKTKPNTALDERQVKEDSEKIRDYYQKVGYNEVSVTYRVDRDRSTGFGTVVFEIREGDKVKIADVRFVGNHFFKSKKLRGTIETKRWWIFSWLTDSGRFQDDQFEDDLGTLRDYYQDHGFLDVEIPQDRVLFEYPNRSHLIITIFINEGRRYRVGEITFSGNKVHSSALLRKVIRSKPGAVFSPSRLDKDVSRLEDFYGKDGYLNDVENGTRVRLVRKPNLTTGNIDIEYQVDEGQRFNVESIVIEGNVKTKSTVILRELALAPGDVFNTTSMKICKLSLDNTRYFENVDVTPQDTNIPGRENLRIAVEEGKTGTLTFGAGFSTLEGADIFAEVSQSNFDLFNSRSFFQGGGEKFRIRVELGELENAIIVSFDEPWLFEKMLDLSFSFFRTSNDYESTYYQEIDSGATISLRKRLFELIDATLEYEFEVVSIDDVSTSASPIIIASAGDTTESKVSLSLTRNTVDKLIDTTSGNKLNFTATLAGGPFGGQANYYKLEFQGAQFFPVFQTLNQVLSLLAHGGVMDNYGSYGGSASNAYGGSGVPYFDAFYLGGPTDLRGFAYREVSPRDIYGEPIGGKTYGFFSAEYTFDVISPIRFAVFYDAGFVNPGAYDFNVNNYNDDYGIGLRMFVMGAPLSLDYGIPIRGDNFYPNKNGGQFNFSFGTRF
jgi:outer membrane protein insertion porin family